MDGKKDLTFSLLLISIILSAWGIELSYARHLCYQNIDRATVAQTFNPLTQICCNGQIFAKNGIDKDCCAGRVIYNKELEICCGTEIYKRTTQDGYNKGCCGNETFVADGSSFCCGNKNLFKSKGDGEGCCGSSRKDLNSETCCDDEDNVELHSNKLHHMCCGTKYFNTSSHECTQGNRIVPKNLTWCGGKQYNIHLYSCCNGNIIMEPMGMYDSCCGTQKYNIKNEKCCEAGHVISSDQVCCGSGVATKSQRCCQNNTLNITSSTQECCGSHLYDRTKGQGCCNFYNGVYDIYKMTCCKGRIFPKNASCCGNGTHNKESTVCCNDEYAVFKQQPDHNKCCAAGSIGQSFNDKTESCVKRNGLPLVEPGTTRCGTSLYSPEKDLCCASKLYSNVVKYGMKCCAPGDKAYNPSTEICCNFRVFSKGEFNSCDEVDTVKTINKPGWYGEDTRNKPDDDLPTENDVYDDTGNENTPDDDLDPENDVNGDTGNENTPDDDLDTEKNMNGDTEYEGICKICRMSAIEASRKIKQGDIDVCHNNANKFDIKRERPEKQYQFLGVINSNIYGKKKGRQTQRVHIPCNCRINMKQVIIITDKPARKSKLFLDDRDIVLPYSKQVRRQIRKVHKVECKDKTDVKELLNDLKVYLLQLQIKVNKLENKVVD